MTTPIVSYVVVAFHRPDSLATLLAAARDEAIELIVANVEADAAVSRVAAAAGATVVDIASNPGYAAGVNAGTAVASAPVVVFSNDDVLASAVDIVALASVVGSGRAAVAVPKIVDANGRHELTIAPLPTVGALAREWMLLPDKPVAALASRMRVQKWQAPQTPTVISSATAAIVAASRDLLAVVPLPEAYFLYWEESDWFWRLHERGDTVEYHPEIAVQHRGGRDDVRADKAALMARNAVRCVRRTQGRARAALAVPVVVLWSLRLLVFAALRRRDVAARRAGLVAALASVREVWR